MAAQSQKLLFVSLLLSLTLASLPGSESFSESPSLVLLGDGLDWPISYGDILGVGGEDDFDRDGTDADAAEEDGGGDRRSLFWRRRRYYISYGALSANRIPCPPRSGRSYYTHNCYRARGPVHPYSRGCSMITRCRR
ncbi:PREDICTED: protein RALF-like 34 [Tarenaya hassleriana]|uniref:protein RALF-like 34 n=1 Tax=Tarenaya hassleriana TaxID=28532 RepID=UPI00053C6D23|nr:PREDICTED: protein RALF-like 34 [Tarenaya hassleriana]